MLQCLVGSVLRTSSYRYWALHIGVLSGCDHCHVHMRTNTNKH
jgi:hypothetical protein